jgi:hypothetical protein
LAEERSIYWFPNIDYAILLSICRCGLALVLAPAAVAAKDGSAFRLRFEGAAIPGTDLRLVTVKAEANCEGPQTFTLSRARLEALLESAAARSLARANGRA